MKYFYPLVALCCGLSLSVQVFAFSPSEVQSLIVVKNFSVSFDISTSEDILDFGLVEAPTFGTIWQDGQSVVYEPHPNICEEVDIFAYYIKTPSHTDTVQVMVEILCESLTVLNGFSTATDKDPTTFTILGIENYPDNSLYVFNDRGNQVFSKKGYHNEWDGTYNGEPLPENGTYYYVFNDGTGNTYSGYIQLN